MKINLMLFALIILSSFLGIDAEVTVRNDTGKKVLIGEYGLGAGRAFCSEGKEVKVEEQDGGLIVHYGSRRKKRVAHWVSLPDGASTVRLVVERSKDYRGCEVINVLAKKI